MDANTEALSKVGKGVWSAATIVGALLGGFLVIYTYDHKWATAAAQEVVAPVEKRVTELETKEQLRQKAEQHDRNRIFNLLTALCVANPNAKCPQE